MPPAFVFPGVVPKRILIAVIVAPRSPVVKLCTLKRLEPPALLSKWSAFDSSTSADAGAASRHAAMTATSDAARAPKRREHEGKPRREQANEEEGGPAAASPMHR